MTDTLNAFTALCEEYVEVTLRHNPAAATLAGIHDYDGQLPDHSPAGFAEQQRWLRDFDQRLVASVPWEELPTEQRVDFAVMRSRIATARAELDEIRNFTKNPALYPEIALDAVFLVAARPFVPLEERKESILSRLMAIPDYLEAARANLGQVPAVFRGLASEVNSSGPAFVDDVARTLLERFPDEEERVEHAASRARVGFTQFQEFLDRDLKGRIGGTFAIGERWMNYKLEHEHLMAMDCAALEARGREHVERTRQMLAAEARAIDPARSWREQIAEAKHRHPEPMKLREAYVAEVERARRFVVERRIAPIPEAALEIIDTPIFERAVIPYAAYLPPAPFDADQTGYFLVTPVDLARSREEQEQQLQGHGDLSIALTVIHESWPGHHLQLCQANRVGSRLRRLADSNLLCEGWALYCEELMHEQGFYTDPTTRLFQLKDLLWRACRVVIDVGLHTGRMTFEEAVDYLVDQAMVERVNAEGEIKRYTMTPTQPMSYLMGKLQILELRDEAKKKLGAKFDLHDFHAAVLASGSIQPALVREELWGRLGVA